MEVELKDKTSGSNQQRSSLNTPITTISLDCICDTAVTAARYAGQLQLQQFRNISHCQVKYSYDIKAEMDRLCEDQILSVIRKSFPDHSILSEESGYIPADSSYLWIIDPLDGTVNFCHGLPYFCVSIACYIRLRTGPSDNPLLVIDGTSFAPLVGTVYLPYIRECFVAVSGKGSECNGKPMSSPSVNSLSDTLLALSFGKNPMVMKLMVERLSRILPKVRKVRCLGAAAAEMAYIGAGHLDGLFYEGLKPWDFAAGKIILEEVGGFVNATETEPGAWQIFACAPGIKSDLIRILPL